MEQYFKRKTKGGDIVQISKEGDKRYTYSDYETWDENIRCELIDGAVFMMSAPSRAHQDILGELFFRFRGYLSGKPCRVYMAPFDVRLNFDSKDDTVVQPDLLIVCDNSKLDRKGCNGAPDFIVEIVSSSSAGYDTIVKLAKYMRAGVKEYWIIDPDNKSVVVVFKKNEEYITKTYNYIDIIPVNIFDIFHIDMGMVFDRIDYIDAIE
jgi:Uma2 family endonuclease